MKSWLVWIGWGGIALIPLTIMLYRLGALALSPAFMGSLLGSALAMVAGLIVLGMLIFGRSLSPATLSVIVAGCLPFVAVLLTVGVSGFKAPPIHDITTDTKTPPQFDVVVGLRTETENSLEYAGEELASKQQAAYPDVKPVLLPANANQAFTVAEAAIAALGWEIQKADSQRLQLEATERSTLFNFADDVVVRVLPHNDGSRIDMRSVSRVGVGDLGANAKRIRRFFEQYCAEAEAQLNVSCTELQVFEQSE